MEKLEPEAIAAALVQALRKDLPAPEDVLAAGQRPERGTDGPRPGFEGANWFRLNAGRRHNADPRWLLPLICRYGHVGRTEIGAIRIAASESYFQVSERATPGFIKALRRATIGPEDQGLVIEPAPPRDAPSARPPSNHRPRTGARKGAADQEAAAAQPRLKRILATARHCGRGSNSASSFARHSPSMMPSMRSGRKRRWKAMVAFIGSVTS